MHMIWICSDWKRLPPCGTSVIRMLHRLWAVDYRLIDECQSVLREVPLARTPPESIKHMCWWGASPARVALLMTPRRLRRGPTCPVRTLPRCAEALRPAGASNDVPRVRSQLGEVKQVLAAELQRRAAQRELRRDSAAPH